MGKRSKAKRSKSNNNSNNHTKKQNPFFEVPTAAAVATAQAEERKEELNADVPVFQQEEEVTASAAAADVVVKEPLQYETKKTLGDESKAAIETNGTAKEQKRFEEEEAAEDNLPFDVITTATDIDKTEKSTKQGNVVADSGGDDDEAAVDDTCPVSQTVLTELEAGTEIAQDRPVVCGSVDDDVVPNDTANPSPTLQVEDGTDLNLTSSSVVISPTGRCSSSPTSAIQELNEAAVSQQKSKQQEQDLSLQIEQEPESIDEAVAAVPYDEISDTPEKTNQSPSNVKENDTSKDATRSDRPGEPDVASHLYEGAKGAWAWSKCHIPLASLWMGLTESFANSVIQTSLGRNLNEVDQTIIKPHIAGFDSDLLNPAIHAVVEAIMKEGDRNDVSSSGPSSHKTKDSHPYNFLRQFIFALLRPPVHFLIKSHVQEKTPQGEKPVVEA
jgi:hypothetical protein